MKMLIRCLVFFIIRKAINAQFLEQPDAGTVFVPTCEKATFNCAVEEEYFADWLIGLPDGFLINIADVYHIRVLNMTRNITAKWVNSNGVEVFYSSRSSLSLRLAQKYPINGTNITCFGYNLYSKVFGNTVVVIFRDAQFLEQPDSGTVFVPVNGKVTFNCSVTEGYYVEWLVGLPDGYLVNAGNTIVLNVLTTQRNITAEGVASSRSTLSVREPDHYTNNGTNITCVARNSCSRLVGNTVVVKFYGPPPPPTDLRVTENELGTLSISWSLGFIEGVPVNYTLTVLNLNTTSAQPIIFAGVLDQHYVFETSRLWQCGVYRFTVTAVTAAGSSAPSQETIATIGLC